MTHHNSSISNFKLFCFKFLLPFLGLFILIGYTFQYCFERNIILKSEINGAYKINRVINDSDKSEIPMFGSSRVLGNVIPGMLGPRYFNYGLNGTQDDVILFFLSEELKKNKTTPILINFDIDGLNSSIGDIAYYLYNINNSNVQQLIGGNNQLHYHIPAIKYFGFYERYFKDYLTNRIALTKFTNRGASVEKNALLPSVFKQVVELRKNYSWTFKNDLILQKRFDDLLTRHPNRMFIFIIAPYHQSCFYKFNNEAGLNSYLQHLQSYKNVRVLNFSKASYPDSLYFNTQHLNYNGAVKFSTTLKDTLTKLGF
jgi:hypothetical protein